MSATRFRHCANIARKNPQVLSGGLGDQHGQNVPWTREFAERVFSGEWLDSMDGPRELTAAIDDEAGRVVGAVIVRLQIKYVGIEWHPPVGHTLPELKLSLREYENTTEDYSQTAGSGGFPPGEVEANLGRLRMSHLQWFLPAEDGSGCAVDWIIAPDCLSRRNANTWDQSKHSIEELTEYEDHGLTPEDLWFDYPEFDRYDDLIFRDAPVLEKLGVPAEIRLKPVPPMPDEVSG